MAKGNQIIVSSKPGGKYLGGTIGDTSKPGTIMQVKTGTAMSGGGGGEPTWVAAATGTDGKCTLLAVLLEDSKQGKSITDAYVNGTQCEVYVPLPGEDINILAGEVAGTGNTVAIGDRFIIDAEDGILVPETGSPQETVAVAMEAYSQQAGSTLTWMKIIK